MLVLFPGHPRAGQGIEGIWRSYSFPSPSWPLVVSIAAAESSFPLSSASISHQTAPRSSDRLKGKNIPMSVRVANILLGDYVEKFAVSFSLCFGESPSPFGSSPSVSAFVPWVLRADVLVDVLVWFPRWPRLNSWWTFPPRTASSLDMRKVFDF